MTTAVCSLFERSYHIGFAVLTNSLYRAGFRGVVYAGYRGALPPWARTATASAAPDGTLRLTVAPDLELRFMEVSTDRHLTNFKARFMQRVWAHAPEVEALFYFDPDIVVRGRWPFFERWVAGGVALCEDLNYRMPPNHPHRNEWRQLFAPLGVTCRRELDAYFNAGFIGIRRQDASFIDLWERLISFLPSVGGSLATLDWGDRTQPIEKPDQDALNVAAMACDVPLSVVGPDGMDFVPGGYIMSHAVGMPKPWQKGFTVAALRGRRPSRADKQFLDNAETPLAPFTRAQLLLKKLDLSVGAAIGRYLG